MGPYRFVQNPMAITGTMQGVAVGLWLGSPGVVSYSVLGMLVWNYFARPCEEADLLRRFGEPYARYRDEVRCWVPRRKPYAIISQVLSDVALKTARIIPSEPEEPAS
jgi:protein-S-isoprenylcysteine O-methyltransferase Ste14